VSAFGEYVRDRRKAAGLTVTQAAYCCRTTPRTLASVEAGGQAFVRWQWPRIVRGIPGVTMVGLGLAATRDRARRRPSVAAVRLAEMRGGR